MQMPMLQADAFQKPEMYSMSAFTVRGKQMTEFLQAHGIIGVADRNFATCW